MTTEAYTLTDPNNGTIIGRGLSVAEAADAIMSFDGQEWEIRRSIESDGSVRLGVWTQKQCADLAWEKWSFDWSVRQDADPEDEAAARAAIFAKIIRDKNAMRPLDIYADAEWDRIEADAIAAEAE